MRDRGNAAAASGRPATTPGHVGRCPCLVNKYKPLWVKTGLAFAPRPTRQLNVFPFLFAGVQGFF